MSHRWLEAVGFLGRELYISCKNVQSVSQAKLLTGKLQLIRMVGWSQWPKSFSQSCAKCKTISMVLVFELSQKGEMMWSIWWWQTGRQSHGKLRRMVW